jgi:hypothetical protein
MTFLTPKARNLVDLAIRQTENAEHARIWRIWSADHPVSLSHDRNFPELTPEAARVVLEALRHFSTLAEAKIQSGHLEEDDLSDLDNDLSFAKAIENDLTKSLSS